MLFLIVDYLMKHYPHIGGLRVFKYITFRAAAALILAFIISIIIGPYIINVLRDLKYGKNIRKITKKDGIDLYEMHKGKQGTPTMGGVLIIITVFISVFLFADLLNPFIGMLIIMSFGFTVVGFIDDYLGIIRKTSRGLTGKQKMLMLLTLGFVLGVFMFLSGQGIYYEPTKTSGNTHICIPFFKNLYPDLSWFYILFVLIIITASTNAVNLTDGLDGLAIGISTIAAIAFAVIAYMVGRFDYSRYLLVPFVPGAGEITVFLGALSGAGMGFLWYNSHPAEVFMGDTGSLTLGGILGTVAVMVKQEIILGIIGGIFVLEALSVILQVGSYKLRGKRIFLMAPIHHHFEKKGWAESKIIARFWIIALLLALFGLATLKLR